MGIPERSVHHNNRVIEPHRPFVRAMIFHLVDGGFHDLHHGFVNRVRGSNVSRLEPVAVWAC